jgi:tetratricopeptide (TPR) repeat protein
MNDFDKYFGRIGGAFTIIGVIVPLFLPSWIQVWLWTSIGFIILLWLSFFLGRKSVKIIFVKQQFTDALIEFFNNKKLEGKDTEIIRWGLAISTPLWLSQKYEIRKKIGEFVEDSAINLDNYKALIKVLIDDIGWTSVELLDYTFAESKLLQAIELATTYKEFHLLAKGYRHLFGLNFRKRNFNDAEEFLKRSFEITDKLPEDKRKDELLGEYYFAKSSLEHKKGNFQLAFDEIEKAKQQYEKLTDKEWIIKITARKGEILVSMNKIEEAKNLFKKGLNESTKLQFNRQIVKNLIGLGICNYTTRYDTKALERFNQAQEIAENIGMYYELEIIKIEKLKLKPR